MMVLVQRKPRCVTAGSVFGEMRTGGWPRVREIRIDMSEVSDISRQHEKRGIDPRTVAQKIVADGRQRRAAPIILR
jgi:hypothetical protein